MYDLVVLGGGSAGRGLALAAARVGARVALVEIARPGAACGHALAIQSKALVAAARLAQQVRGAHEAGVNTGPVTIDFAAVMARVRAVAAGFAARETDEALRSQGVTVIHGTPAFEAHDTVLIDGQTRLHGQRFVIATGSRPAIPAIPGLAEAGVLDPRSIWDLSAAPEELVVIGSDPNGVELAQALARLGSKVTLVTSSASILPGEDPEVASRVQVLLEAEGITFRTHAEVRQVVVRDGRKTCTVADRAGGATGELSATHLLVAAGRLANVDGLNLEAVEVHGDPEHGIEVDEFLQTRSTRILAIGDVLPGHPFAHAAQRQAAVALQNAVLRIPRKIDYAALPRATFIDPEVASVGLSEAEALSRHPEARVLRLDLAELDRARIEGRTEGFAKLIAIPGGKILGATVLGPEAALVLQEVVLAMEHGLTLQNIAETAHIYPSYSGAIERLASAFAAQRLDNSLVHKALRWFHGYQPRTSSDNGGTGTETEAEAEAGAASDSHAAPAAHSAGQGQGHGHDHSHGHAH